MQAQIRALQEEAAVLEDQIQAGGMSKPKQYAVRLAGWCISGVGGAWWNPVDGIVVTMCAWDCQVKKKLATIRAKRIKAERALKAAQ